MVVQHWNGVPREVMVTEVQMRHLGAWVSGTHGSAGLRTALRGLFFKGLFQPKYFTKTIITILAKQHYCQFCIWGIITGPCPPKKMGDGTEVLGEQAMPQAIL